MKKMLHICLIALAALAGCAKEAPVQTSLQREDLIRWDTSMDDTKVYPSGTEAYPTSSTFGSYAMLYYGTSESDWPSAHYTAYIAGLQVRYFGVSTPFWSTANEYYWPTTTNSRLHFASFSPYVTLHNKAVYGGQARGIYIPNYTVPADKVNQHYTTDAADNVLYDDDLMVSNEYDVSCEWMQDHDVSTYAFTGVPTLFRHIMTRINVYFKQNDDFSVDYYDSQTISIRKLKFNNIYTRGTYTALTSGVQSDTWSNQGAQVDSAILFKSNVGTNAIALKSSGDSTRVVSGYIAIPQTIAASTQQVEVTYRITSTVSGYLFTEDITETAYLTAAGKNWVPGTDLTYTITLSAIRTQPILFEATCDAWKDDIVSGNEVPGQNFHLTPED